MIFGKVIQPFNVLVSSSANGENGSTYLVRYIYLCFDIFNFIIKRDSNAPLFRDNLTYSYVSSSLNCAWTRVSIQ